MYDCFAIVQAICYMLDTVVDEFTHVVYLGTRNMTPQGFWEVLGVASLMCTLGRLAQTSVGPFGA